MIDVKRLITIFLIFAASVSSFAIGASYFSSTPPAASTNVATQSTTAAPLAKNAFLPLESIASDNSLPAPADDVGVASGNLTDNVAGYLTRSIFVDNPNGPVKMSNGQVSLASPTAASVMSQIANDPALKNFAPPDWDSELASMNLNVVQNADAAAKQAYGKAFSDLENKYFIQTDLSGLFNKGADSTNAASNASFAKQQIDGAIATAVAMPVPDSLLPFHKSFLKLLTYERNALGTLDIAQTDPFKAQLILQAKELDYNKAETEFEALLPSAQAFLQGVSLDAESHPRGGVAGIVNNIFGIHEAHAQFFGGVVFDPAVFGRLVFDFLQSVLLQILKNQIVTLLQNKVLKLIQNGGDPKIIQNWSGFLNNAFNSAVGSAIGEILPGLCPNFSAPLGNWLQDAYSSAQITPGGIALNGSAGTTCDLQAAIPNQTAYFNNFNQGGFDAFGAMFRPNNNIFGAFITAKDSIEMQAESQSTAAQNRALAANGGIGAEICSDGSDPSTSGAVCPDGSDPIITLPGKNFMDSLSRNMNSDIDLIVNANDITGLLATIAGALMQQIIQSGANGLFGSSPAGTGVRPPAPPPPQPVVCSPNNQSVAIGTTATFAATGGTASTVFTWTGGVVPASGTGPSFSTSFFTAGTYSVSVTASTGGGANCQVTVF